MWKGKAEEPTGSEIKFSECYFPNLKSHKERKEKKENDRSEFSFCCYFFLSFPTDDYEQQ